MNSNRLRYLRVFFIFFFLFALSTKFWVSSWNDASRMAAIQAIVEQGSFIIDNSIFETGDKYLFNHHFYSDKPPILALYASPVYLVLKELGVSFESYPKLAHYLITIFSIGSLSALGLVVFRMILTQFFHVNNEWADLTTLVTGIGTLILAYSSVFNNHIASGSLLLIGFYFLLNFGKNGRIENVVYSGLMFSLAGSIDTNCFLFIPFALFLFFRRSVKAGLVFVISGLPIITLYLLLNLFTSGSFLPPPLNASLWNYPGSDFDQANLSGLATHKDISDLVVYAFHMILGNRGLISHSPILIFSFVGLVVLYKNNQSFEYKTEYAVLFFASLLYIGIYILRTVNYSGHAFGVRWFASLMLILCLPITSIESWVRSSRIKYGIFVVVACLSILIAIIGIYNPFIPSSDISAGQAHLVENTIFVSINLFVTESTFFGKVRILLVSFVAFFLFLSALGKSSPSSLTKRACTD